MKLIKNLVHTWRARVAVILKWLRRYSNFMVMQHRLQSMAGAAAHLDRHCRHGKEHTIRLLIRALRPFEGSDFIDDGLDRRVLSLIVGCGYSDHSCDNERPCLLGAGQLPQEARRRIIRIINSLIASIPQIIVEIRDNVSQTPHPVDIYGLILVLRCKSIINY